MTLATAVIVGLLVVAHEYLLLRRPGRGWMRRGLLVVLVGLAVYLGTYPGVASRVRTALSTERQVAPFRVDLDPSGDPLFLRSLGREVPSRPYPSSGSRTDVEQWRDDVRRRLAEQVGYPTASPRVKVRVARVDELDGLRRTLIVITSWDGTEIPAYVHEPMAVGKRPGVLVVPGHGAGIRGTAGLVDDYQHAAAREIAERGFVTLTPESRGFGALSPGEAASHRLVAFAALEAGTSYKAIVVKDLAHGLSALEAWNGVDAERLAVTGASLGGELAVLLGVLDLRIRAVASQSYGGMVGPASVDARVDDESGQTPHGCHTMPGINKLVWHEDWFRLLAPRPVLVTRGQRNVPAESPEFTRALTEAYGVLGATDRFAFERVPGGHEFFVDSAVAFLERWSR